MCHEQTISDKREIGLRSCVIDGETRGQTGRSFCRIIVQRKESFAHDRVHAVAAHLSVAPEGAAWLAPRSEGTPEFPADDQYGCTCGWPQSRIHSPRPQDTLASVALTNAERQLMKLNIFLQQFEVNEAFVVGGQDKLAGVSALCDVVGNINDYDTGQTCHSSEKAIRKLPVCPQVSVPMGRRLDQM